MSVISITEIFRLRARRHAEVFTQIVGTGSYDAMTAAFDELRKRPEEFALVELIRERGGKVVARQAVAARHA